ncbi:MAG: efflux RND transporter periplasmic adaptor subunit [Flavobacteriales bacterium]|nr:efflux RND transporter periplasmic adaptor subunit [Flavobacteriales bacterium]
MSTPFTMRTVLLSIPVLALFAACGPTEVTDAEVQRHRELRDSLKSAREAINEAIAQEEAWLAKNDPELRRTLPSVTTLALASRDFAHYTEAHGSVKADENALLYSSTGGEVRRILVRAGQPVRKGQLIVDIDTDVLRSNIAQAEANVELARDVFARQAKLWEQKIGSELQYLEAKSRKESSEAQLAALQEQLRSAQVFAPFDGVVDEIFPNVGDMATAMQPVARVVSLGKASIETDLSEDMLEKVKLGDPVTVELPETGATIQATIDQIGQYINPNNRTFKVTLRMENGVKLRPNQLANVRIQDLSVENGTVVPSRLVMENAKGESYVYLLDSSEGMARAKKQFVKVLAAQGGDLLIEAENLKPGDLLIDQGSRLVVDRQEVNVMQGA